MSSWLGWELTRSRVLHCEMELILPPSRRRGRNRREENRKISGSPPGEPSPASFPPVELHGPRLAGDSTGKGVKDGNRTAIWARGGVLVYVGAALTKRRSSRLIRNLEDLYVWN